MELIAALAHSWRRASTGLRRLARRAGAAAASVQITIAEATTSTTIQGSSRIGMVRLISSKLDVRGMGTLKNLIRPQKVRPIAMPISEPARPTNEPSARKIRPTNRSEAPMAFMMPISLVF